MLFAEQSPAPLQVNPAAAFPTHWLAPHDVPAAYSWHAPPPLHMPSRLQDAAPSSAQSECGSVPVFAGPHSPSMPPCFRAAEQATQGFVQEVSQQSPSVQWPELHCRSLVQEVPVAMTDWHEESEVRQKLPAAQSLSAAQEVAQDVPFAHL